MTLLVELLTSATVVLLIVTLQLFCHVKRMEKRFLEMEEKNKEVLEHVISSVHDVKASTETMIQETRVGLKETLELGAHRE